MNLTAVLGCSESVPSVSPLGVSDFVSSIAVSDREYTPIEGEVRLSAGKSAVIRIDFAPVNSLPGQFHDRAVQSSKNWQALLVIYPVGDESHSQTPLRAETLLRYYKFNAQSPAPSLTSSSGETVAVEIPVPPKQVVAGREYLYGMLFARDLPGEYPVALQLFPACDLPPPPGTLNATSTLGMPLTVWKGNLVVTE
jgi:hypothetical protein